jgi:hypothetical protein
MVQPRSRSPRRLGWALPRERRVLRETCREHRQQATASSPEPLVTLPHQVRRVTLLRREDRVMSPRRVVAERPAAPALFPAPAAGVAVVDFEQPR